MTVEKYISLITQEHIDKPDFKATVGIITQAYSDIQDVLHSYTYEFDLDVAIGAQLDAVGLWIGQSRTISLLIEGVYFTWDDRVVTGWDSGVWFGIGDPTNEIVVLDDITYRKLLYAKILSNNWKGDRESIYAIFDAFVTPTTPILVQDNQGQSQPATMIMTITITEGSMSELELAIIKNGYVIVAPAGVQVVYNII